ncbi:peroxiredoxin [Photobacterium lucens]|uniref:peroxiredoxin n=1 Tax=Photobacterium lucens TaxID=2562949 RepID=UPI0006B41FD4|nr:peroxiredoxin [Photobacterium lucens]KPA53284.1 thioredoxin peroxidase [Photobacterium leiognathi subsp. mandapamensis]MBP2699523.1 peroxiredoxin [Vibrio parahaemolyticus]MZG55773.1 peroxiredoxin [Photobacterium lucens]MZG81764.1 peroxiredoxin [Photobacterium lucens]PSV20623.1 peroxiredoxin [Photobacterium leiognathi subsp. mandapamensis]
MKKLTLLTALLLSGSAFAQFATTDANANFGQKQVVTLEKTTTFNLSGKALNVGDYMPSMQLVTSDLKPFDTSTETNSVKIYNVLTSVDTPVCIQQAIDLSKFVADNKAELKGIEFLAISADTPFAQQRFQKNHKLTNITYLSDSSKHQFGMKTGSQIEELGLLTRSIIVTDKNNKVIYTQRVPELTTIPDLQAAVKIAQANL